MTSNPSDYSATEVVALLGLLPHPEGGFYRETYRSTGNIARVDLPRGFSGGGPRCFSTSVLYLLPQGACSRLHRLPSDETWYFHQGGPLVVAHFGDRGNLVILGPDLLAGHLPQFTVPAGAWFGAEVTPGTDWALVGCAVAPGFDFSDLEMAEADAMLERYPDQRDLIMRLTPRR